MILRYTLWLLGLNVWLKQISMAIYDRNLVNIHRASYVAWYGQVDRQVVRYSKSDSPLIAM